MNVGSIQYGDRVYKLYGVCIFCQEDQFMYGVDIYEYTWRLKIAICP